jgi:hypothetical protein
MATKSKPKTLPDDEVQALADQALAVWESGIDGKMADTLGGVWLVWVERSANSGLWMVRTLGVEPDAVVTGKAFVSGAEFARAEHIGVILASRVLGAVNPV